MKIGQFSIEHHVLKTRQKNFNFREWNIKKIIPFDIYKFVKIALRTNLSIENK